MNYRFLLVVLCFFSLAAYTQPVSTASQKILYQAQLHLTSLHACDWDDYVESSYPGVVKYYGGMKGYVDHSKRKLSLNTGVSELNRSMTLLQVVREKDEWQCVVERSAIVAMEGRHAQLRTYLIGHSSDAGKTWKFFEVESTGNSALNHIMPGLSSSIRVPQKAISFDLLAAGQ
jgi:hypothetical protein